MEVRVNNVIIDQLEQEAARDLLHFYQCTARNDQSIRTARLSQEVLSSIARLRLAETERSKHQVPPTAD